jgi:hypothetical protein
MTKLGADPEGWPSFNARHFLGVASCTQRCENDLVHVWPVGEADEIFSIVDVVDLPTTGTRPLEPVPECQAGFSHCCHGPPPTPRTTPNNNSRHTASVGHRRNALLQGINAALTGVPVDTVLVGPRDHLMFTPGHRTAGGGAKGWRNGRGRWGPASPACHSTATSMLLTQSHTLTHRHGAALQAREHRQCLNKMATDRTDSSIYSNPITEPPYTHENGSSHTNNQTNYHKCIAKYDQARGRTKVTYSYDALEML